MRVRLQRWIVSVSFLLVFGSAAAFAGEVPQLTLERTVLGAPDYTPGGFVDIRLAFSVDVPNVFFGGYAEESVPAGWTLVSDSGAGFLEDEIAEHGILRIGPPSGNGDFPRIVTYRLQASLLSSGDQVIAGHAEYFTTGGNQNLEIDDTILSQNLVPVLGFSRTVPDGEFVPGSPFDVTVHFTPNGEFAALQTLEENFSPGLRFLEWVSGPEPRIQYAPAGNAPRRIVFHWDDEPAVPETITYRVIPAAQTTRDQAISGFANYRHEGEPWTRLGTVVVTDLVNTLGTDAGGVVFWRNFPNGREYTPGGQFAVQLIFDFEPGAGSWKNWTHTEDLPAGWYLDRFESNNTGITGPSMGDSGSIAFASGSVSPPVTVDYVLNVPRECIGPKQIQGSSAFGTPTVITTPHLVDVLEQGSVFPVTFSRTINDGEPNALPGTVPVYLEYSYDEATPIQAIRLRETLPIGLGYDGYLRPSITAGAPQPGKLNEIEFVLDGKPDEFSFVVNAFDVFSESPVLHGTIEYRETVAGPWHQGARLFSSIPLAAPRANSGIPSLEINMVSAGENAYAAGGKHFITFAIRRSDGLNIGSSDLSMVLPPNWLIVRSVDHTAGGSLGSGPAGEPGVNNFVTRPATPATKLYSLELFVPNGETGTKTIDLHIEKALSIDDSTVMIENMISLEIPEGAPSAADLVRTINDDIYYRPGATEPVVVTVYPLGTPVFDYIGSYESLPRGWSVDRLACDNAPPIPMEEDRGRRVAWRSGDAQVPFSFKYFVNVPVGQERDEQITGPVRYRLKAETYMRETLDQASDFHIAPEETGSELPQFSRFILGQDAYRPGQPIDVVLALQTAIGIKGAFTFVETLPPGWSLEAVIAGQEPKSVITDTDTNTATLVYPKVDNLGRYSVYHVNVPADALGIQSISGVFSYTDSEDIGHELSLETPIASVVNFEGEFGCEGEGEGEGADEGEGEGADEGEGEGAACVIDEALADGFTSMDCEGLCDERPIDFYHGNFGQVYIDQEFQEEYTGTWCSDASAIPPAIDIAITERCYAWDYYCEGEGEEELPCGGCSDPEELWSGIYEIDGCTVHLAYNVNGPRPTNFEDADHVLELMRNQCAEGEGEGIDEGEGEGEGEGIDEGEGEGISIPFDGVYGADRDGDGLISLSELLRVIQFFNSDGLSCAVPAEATEDGYQPGAGGQSCAPYVSDYNPQDWDINLSELLRVIQFFNGGGYHYCPDADPPTEDDYCLGPPPAGRA